MTDVLGVMPTFLRTEQDLDTARVAIETFRATCSADLLVIDDGSPFGTNMLSQVAKENGIDMMPKEENEGFSRTVNLGLRRARREGKHAVLVNADIQFFHNGWLSEMLANDADVVGAQLLFPNGLVQHAGIYYSVISRQFDHIFRFAPSTLAAVQEPRICPVTGALQLIKSQVIKEIGFYDENFRMGYEDVDYCHMAFQAGMKCAYEPKAIAIHHEGMFRHRDPSEKLKQWTIRSWDYLHEKHAGVDFSEYVPTLLEWGQ